MRTHLTRLCIFVAMSAMLCSCRVSAPQLDYQALARASIRLGMDIGFEDNHALYLNAAEWIGVPYRSGGNSKRGVDCSGLTTQLYHAVYHHKLPRSSKEQMSQCKKVSRRKLHAGDLVFFSSPRSRKKVTHVGIYLKNDRFIHASSTQGVIISSLTEPYYQKHWICGGRLKPRP